MHAKVSICFNNLYTVWSIRCSMYACIHAYRQTSMHPCIHAYQCISHIYIYTHITPKNHNQIIQHVCLLQFFLRCFPIFPQPREASRPASRGKLVDGLAPSTSTVNRRVEEMEVGVGQVIRKVPRFHQDF